LTFAVLLGNWPIHLWLCFTFSLLSPDFSLLISEARFLRLITRMVGGLPILLDKSSRFFARNGEGSL
jgi:hypothetical protein